jgi:hypothetical protein
MVTFWATVWYAGTVVMVLGYEGQNADQCNTLSQIIENDIAATYENPTEEVTNSIYPTNEFSVTCEQKILQPQKTENI